MRGKPELDDPHNIGDVCRQCHSQWIGTGGYAVIKAWWAIKCARYGEEDMRRWVESLPLKVKEKFD